MTQQLDKSYLDGLVPRSLLSEGKDALGASVSSEGLCPLRIHLKKGLISRIEVINNVSKYPQQILLPRLFEPHAHLDKVFTWQKFPNLEGSYQGALKANLREHANRKLEDVFLRADKAMKLAFRNGICAIRSHIDSFGLQGQISWEALTQIKNKWSNLIDLQYVALVPLEYWSSREGEKLALQIASCGGILGGVIVPPAKKRLTYNYLKKLIYLANKYECEIDIHIDESQVNPAFGLKLLIKVIENVEVKIPITCSHSSSMLLLPSRELAALANKLAFHKVNVIALPITNAWLLGRSGPITTLDRPFAPIYQLQKAGVNVAIGGDNVNDPWLPLGNFDPISLMSFSLPFAHLCPWNRLGLSPFTTASAALMKLKWDGTIKKGMPADLMLLNSSSWSETLASLPSRKVFVEGRLINECDD